MRTLICYLNEIGALDFALPVLEQIDNLLPDIYIECILPEYVYKSKPLLLKKAKIHQIQASQDFSAKLSEISKNSYSICGILSSATSSPNEWLLSEFSQRNNFRIIHIIDSFYGYKNRFQYQNLSIFHKYVLLIDQLAKTDAIEEGLEESKLNVVGHPGWEQQFHHLAKERWANRANNHKALFLGAPIRRDYGNSFGFDEDDAWRLVMDTRRQRPDLIKELIYCPHPQQNITENDVSVPLKPFSIDLLKNYGQVFGIFSSPLMTAHLANRLSVSIQPGNTNSDICPFSRRGLIKKAGNATELLEIILNSEDQIQDNVSENMLNKSNDRTLRCLGNLLSLQGLI